MEKDTPQPQGQGTPPQEDEPLRESEVGEGDNLDDGVLEGESLPADDS